MILNPRFDSNGSHGRRGCLPDTADGAAVASSGRRQQRSIDRFVAASPRPLWRRRSTFEQGQAGFGGSASNPVAILPWERGLAGSCSLGRRPFWVEATSKGYFDLKRAGRTVPNLTILQQIKQNFVAKVVDQILNGWIG